VTCAGKDEGMGNQYSECAESRILMDSGSLGDNFTWEVYLDGTLAISGKGPMPDRLLKKKELWDQIRKAEDIERIINKKGEKTPSHASEEG